MYCQEILRLLLKRSKSLAPWSKTCNQVWHVSRFLKDFCSITSEWGDGKDYSEMYLCCGVCCILAFSILCDTSGVTNRLNKSLITVKGNSSGFNRILITAYRCLLVSLNYHAFLLFAVSRMCADKTVYNWLIHSLYFLNTILSIYCIFFHTLYWMTK